MNLGEIIRDSVKYASSDWIKVILLGMVILIADSVNEIHLAGFGADIIKIILIIIGTILGILEVGYIFKIIEETVRGSEKLPKFDKLKEMFIHGVKETIVTVIYALIPSILIIIGLVDIIGILEVFVDEELMSILFIISGLILGLIVEIIYSAAILNMAHHNGAIRSAFQFKKIFRKIKKIGLKKIVFVYILSLFIVFLVSILISDNLKANIPIIGEIISQLIIAPYLLIFTSRVWD